MKFWEVLEQVAEPVRPFITEEEARYNHKRIDCLFPAAGNSVPRLKLPKFRPKPRKVSLSQSPFGRASALLKRKFEPNPWVDESSSNGSSIQKEVVKKKATKRSFNEAFLKEDDQILYVEKPSKETANTSRVLYFEKELDDTIATKKQKTQSENDKKEAVKRQTAKYSLNTIRKFRKCTEETFNISTWTRNQLKSAFPSCLLDDKVKVSGKKFPNLRISKSEGCLTSKRQV